MQATPSLIEREGANWSFRFDLSQLPEYGLLIVAGKSCPARTEQLLEVFDELLPHLQTAQGGYVPIITDLRQDGPLTMEHIRALHRFRDVFDDRSTFTVMLVNEWQGLGALFQSFLVLLRRTTVGSELPVIAHTIEEAQALIEAYHLRPSP